MGVKILSCADCKEGSDGKGAVSPEREGRTSASHPCLTLGSVEGFQLHLVAWEQGCLGGSKRILGMQIRLWAVKTAGELWLVKEAALPRCGELLWPICWWALQGWCWSRPVPGWSALARSQEQGCATHSKQIILRKCYLSGTLSNPQNKSAGKS